MATPSALMQENIGLAWDAGTEMTIRYWAFNGTSQIKPDGTVLTEADEILNQKTLDFFAAKGRGVASEEGGTVPFGAPDAEYVDPLDGTKDYDEGRKASIRIPSSAGYSLGSAENGRFVRGVVNLPLLGSPRLYWAEEGVEGAQRMLIKGGKSRPVEPNREATQGIVMVSDGSGAYKQNLVRMGFRVISMNGAVFKAMCVVDPDLYQTYRPNLIPPDEPIVGYISRGAYPYDYAAVGLIARKAGLVATAASGGEFPLTLEKHGCVIANNEQTHHMLLASMS